MRRQDEKRQLRETKRELKRAGHKKVRAKARHMLETSPEDAHLAEDNYGRYSTAHLNGMDRDATRRLHASDREPPQPDRPAP